MKLELEWKVFVKVKITEAGQQDSEASLIKKGTIEQGGELRDFDQVLEGAAKDLANKAQEFVSDCRGD